MSMASATRRSGLTLAMLGIIGAAFFWATDPHIGPNGHRAFVRHWLFVLRGSPENAVDAANQAFVGTLLGIVGSVCVLLIGLWLLSRRRT